MNFTIKIKYSSFNASISNERRIKLIFLANNKRCLYDRSLEWKTRKILRIEGAEFKCEECPNTKSLEVHHLNYDNFGNENYEDLKVLCKRCHTKFHKNNHCHDSVALNSNKKSDKEKIEMDLNWI